MWCIYVSTPTINFLAPLLHHADLFFFFESLKANVLGITEDILTFTNTYLRRKSGQVYLLPSGSLSEVSNRMQRTDMFSNNTFENYSEYKMFICGVFSFLICWWLMKLFKSLKQWGQINNLNLLYHFLSDSHHYHPKLDFCL